MAIILIVDLRPDAVQCKAITRGGSCGTNDQGEECCTPVACTKQKVALKNLAVAGAKLHTWFRLLLIKTNRIPVTYHCKTTYDANTTDDPLKIGKAFVVSTRKGIATGNATFETSAPDSPAWDKAHMAKHRFVAEIDGKLAGWIALTPVSSRCVYAGVAEVSVYVGATVYQGRKVGSALLERLISDTEADNIWTLQAGVFPENTASIASA
jgi:hypothetical protein